MKLGGRSGLSVFLLALVVRLAATATVGFSTTGFGDASRYVFAASELVRTGRYPDRTEPFFFRPPAYPLFLAGATLGRPEERVASAKAANALLGAGAVVLLAMLSARIFGRPSIALATGLVAAVDPSLVLVSTDVQSEPLFMAFLLSSGLLLLSAADGASAWPAALAGALLGLAALTRPSALALAPLLAAPLLDRRSPGSTRARIAAGALAGLVLALLPWTIRNAVRFHELIPVSDAGGVSLYAGNSAWTRRYYALRTRGEYERWLEDFDLDLRNRLAAIERSGADTPGRRSAAFARMAIDEARSDPGQSLRLLATKAWHWVRPYPTPWFWPRPVVAAIGVLYVLLYAAAARGLWLAPRRGVAAFGVAVLLVSMLAHVALQVVWRYRVPYWDPVLLLYGVFGAATWSAALRDHAPAARAGTF
jgi:4-amino-4-deoxy-L-arabinose transferase-like glycosyltransferase